ncbi:MAG: endo-1,4-beta-xylanase [bacterium]|nr:endo-1,4-beta-xylanase [bacterium]
MNKISKILLIILAVFLCILGYFFLGSPQPAEKINWGVNFSQRYAEQLGIEWKESFLAILDDLGAKKIRLSADWDLIEANSGEYNFNDLDWQINEAEKRDVELILTIGLKTLRWPECHIPEWAKNLTDKEKEEKITTLVKEIVLRYKDNSSVKLWQVENEIFFPFGDCPKISKDFFEKEIQLVMDLDKSGKPILITDSGEFSFWLNSAKYGDLVGTSMYRNAWFGEFNLSVPYPFPPIFYSRRADLVKTFFDKKVIVTEFQAEPWGEKPLYALSLDKQKKLFWINDFGKHIEFAQKTGFDEIYFWGTEWWYWLKTKQNYPEFWNAAKELFKN